MHKGLEDALATSYRLDRELGRGGMATVYLAHDVRHNRRVALKVLHPELGSSIGPDRFLRESTARTQASGERHPFIGAVSAIAEASIRP